MSGPIMSRTTQAGLLTPGGRGAVATIAVQGPGAAEQVDRWFLPASSTPWLRRPLLQIVFGTWRSRDEQACGEELVVCRTAEEQVEIHCHGGRAAAEAILLSLTDSGCLRTSADAWPHPWSDSSGGRIAREALQAVSQASTQQVAAILMDQYRGALQAALEQILTDLRAAAWSSAADRVEALLSWEACGQHLTSAWHVVLAGPANVGKSSLMNALLGYQRSIVFEQPGTTRDVLTAQAALDGWPVEFRDTAGLRAKAQGLEASGIERALAEIGAADLVLLVSDAAAPWPADLLNPLQAAHPRHLLVHNKIDLLPDSRTSDRPSGSSVSALCGHGLDDLAAAIRARLLPDLPPPGQAVPFLARHRDALREARNNIADQHPAALQCIASLLAP